MNAGELFDNRFMGVPKEAGYFHIGARLNVISLLIKESIERIRGNGA